MVCFKTALQAWVTTPAELVGSLKKETHTHTHLLGSVAEFGTGVKDETKRLPTTLKERVQYLLPFWAQKCKKSRGKKKHAPSAQDSSAVQVHVASLRLRLVPLQGVEPLN